MDLVHEERRDLLIQTLGQPAQEIQGHDKVLHVDVIVVGGIVDKGLVLFERFLGDTHAPFDHRLSVRDEFVADGDDETGEALESQSKRDQRVGTGRYETKNQQDRLTSKSCVSSESSSDTFSHLAKSAGPTICSMIFFSLACILAETASAKVPMAS